MFRRVSAAASPTTIPGMLGRLLNAVQRAGEHRPVAAVLAGTPGLLDTLSAGKASFWNRGEHSVSTSVPMSHFRRSA